MVLIGRMGNEIIDVAKKQNDIKIVCGFDREESKDGDFPIYNKIEDINENVDVIIDFSVPVATFEVLKYARKNKIPIVVATTGFDEKQLNDIEKISKETAPSIFLTSSCFARNSTSSCSNPSVDIRR